MAFQHLGILRNDILLVLIVVTVVMRKNTQINLYHYHAQISELYPNRVNIVLFTVRRHFNDLKEGR